MEDALLNHTHWPLYYSRRTRVPQRWPLVLRFGKSFYGHWDYLLLTGYYSQRSGAR